MFVLICFNIALLLLWFRNSIIHYTGQLAKDTKEDLKALVVSNDVGGLGINKEEKMFKEKLTSDFSSILNQFQQAQRYFTVAFKIIMDTIVISDL